MMHSGRRIVVSECQKEDIVFCIDDKEEGVVAYIHCVTCFAYMVKIYAEFCGYLEIENKITALIQELEEIEKKQAIILCPYLRDIL